MKIVISCTQMSLVVKACFLLHAIFIEESSRAPPARQGLERGLIFFGLQGTGPLLQALAVFSRVVHMLWRAPAVDN